MDPLTLALLAGGAVGLIGGAGQIGSSIVKSPYEKKNQERLDALYGKENRGKLGLTGREQQVAQAQLLDPVRAALAAQQRQDEAQLAAAGMSSGAQLARMREQREQATGQAQVSAVRALQEADIEKQKSQRAEIAQREAAGQAARNDRTSALFSGLGQVGGAIGQIAGTVPEVFRMAGVAGTPIRDPDALAQHLRLTGVPDESISLIQSIPPRELTTILDEVNRGVLSSPAHMALQRAIQYDALYRADRALAMGQMSGVGL